MLFELWLQVLRQNGDHSQAATVGRLSAHLATLRHLSLAVTARLALGESPVIEAALVKDLGTEFEQMIPQLIAACTAPAGTSELEQELAATLAYVTQMAPSFSLRGGTREILRSMIARGLDLR